MMHRCAWDLETTGPDPDTARIVTSSFLVLDLYGEIIASEEILFQVDAPIPAGATAVHGISTEHANEYGVDRTFGVNRILDRLREAAKAEAPVATFNGSYDATVLDRECRRLGINTVMDRAFDSHILIADGFVLDKHVDTYRKGSRKLVDVARHYGIDLVDAHTSTADAWAADRVVAAILDAHAGILPADPWTLHEMQKQWRWSQCADLQRYFRRQGRVDAVVNGAWPVQDLPAEWDASVHPVDEDGQVAA